MSTLPHPARVIGVYRRADLPAGTRETCLALWRLADPGNVGTLLRTADAFGASVALSEGCADPLSPKALRASAGAIFRVPLTPWDDRPARCVALAAHGGTPLQEADLSPPVTFLLGAEREGLPDEQVARCDKVTIPLPGGAESLNVAAAGAIALYESTRDVRAPAQRRAGLTMRPWKTRSRRTLLDLGPWVSVESHVVELPDGRVIDDWPWLEGREFVNVVAVTETGSFLVFRQTKYAVAGPTLAPVGGYLDPGEAPATAARRELLEETGHEADHWTSLGGFVVDGNRGCGVGHLYLARGARQVARAGRGRPGGAGAAEHDPRRGRGRRCSRASSR